MKLNLPLGRAIIAPTKPAVILPPLMARRPAPLPVSLVKPAGTPATPPAGMLANLLKKSSENSRINTAKNDSVFNDVAEDVKVLRSSKDERAITPLTQGEYVLVVCSVPSEDVFLKGLGMGKRSKKRFLETANDKNIPTDLFKYISPCPPMPADVAGVSASRETKWLKDNRDSFLTNYNQIVEEHGPPCAILPLGLHATQQVMNKAVKITRIRGQIRHLDEFGVPVIPMISPEQVFRQPGMDDQFKVDFDMVGRLRDFAYDVRAAELAITDVSYSYISGEELLRKLALEKPKAIAFDTETYNGGGGNAWWQGTKPFVFQVAWKKGESYVVPIGSFRRLDTRPLAEREKAYDYWTIDQAEANKNIAAVKQVLESDKYFFTGHNLAYDWHVLQNVGITPNLPRWLHDSMQLMFVRNENTMSKDLATGTRLYVPDLSGYSDAFEDTTDYSRMAEVDPTKMLFYAAADSDASLRMTKYLSALCCQDKRHYNCYQRIQMPALRMFYGMERRGMKVDVEKVREFTATTAEVEDEKYNALVGEMPVTFRNAWFDRKKPKNGLAFTRTKMLANYLFTHPDGLRLTPVVFTASTRKLEEHLRFPSTSAKDHLAFFEDNQWVSDYLEYNKYKTMLKFAGEEGEVGDDGEESEAKGIWKYISPDDGCIHPNFFLHRTNTGRVASSNPNGQNIPKHGPLAKAYRAIFVARPGKCFISVDYSQAELRVAAWEAAERTMIRLYAEGKDLHAATAARTMSLSLEEFMRDVDEEIRDEKRQAAKAVNFGFLFGMWWKKFKAYAKTQYGVTVTDEQAEGMRNAFFSLYPGLEKWHKNKRKFVNETGYVRALHGRIRHLPEIRSYDKGIQQMAERQAINGTVQGFASDLGLIAGIRFTRDVPDPDNGIVSTIHDAMIIECDECLRDEYGSAKKWYMENPPLEKWFGISAPLPLVADVEWGYNLKELQKLKTLPAIKPSWFTHD